MTDVLLRPPNDAQRVATLRGLRVLDTPQEERFDRITRLARRLFDVPIALVSLIDENRQWIKSAAGIGRFETPRDIAFCAHTVMGSEALVVQDATADGRFAFSPLVLGSPNARFYAGHPLQVDAASGSLGTLCVLDRRPREFDCADLQALADLAHIVEHELASAWLAVTDELTGLANRRGFEALARHALGLCRRVQAGMVLVLIDLDGFKQINDLHGHAEGDRALRDFAQLLSQAFRDSDVVCRLGGDEFGVLLTNVQSGAVERVLQRLRRGVEQHNRITRRGYVLRFSAGMVPYDAARHAGLPALMHEADQQMYARKRAAKALSPA